MAYLEKRGNRWSIVQIEPGQKRRHRIATGLKDKQSAKQKLAEFERAIERGEVGLLDPFTFQRKRPISEHLSDYLADLKTTGKDDKYRSNVESRLERLFNDCKWATLPDVMLDSFSRWRDASPTCGGNAGKKGHKSSGKTLNQYLETARAFMNWCVKRQRTASNPLARAEKVAELDVRPRRALTLDEVRRLLAVAPQVRRRPYLVFSLTGLRLQEVKDLRWGDVRLNSPAPFIQLRPEATKARRADAIALTPELVNEFRLMRSADPELTDADSVFPSVPPLSEFREDLKAAEIPENVPGHGQATIHSLRHTLATILAEQNVPRRLAMEHMRLTDPRLLDRTYTDHRGFDMPAVVSSLPRLLPPDPEPLKATGTEGRACQNDAISGGENWGVGAVRGSQKSSANVNGASGSSKQNRPENPSDSQGLAGSVSQGQRSCSSSPVETLFITILSPRPHQAHAKAEAHQRNNSFLVQELPRNRRVNSAGSVRERVDSFTLGRVRARRRCGVRRSTFRKLEHPPRKEPSRVARFKTSGTFTIHRARQGLMTPDL